MPKKIVQDIVPAKKRSIKSVPLKNARIPLEAEENFEPVFVKKPPVKKKPAVSGSRPKSKYLISFIVIFISIVIIGLASSLSYSKAVVTVTPKVVKFDINGTFTANKGIDDNDLGYDVITATEEMNSPVSAVSGVAVQTKSKGTMTIYNNHGTSTQVLVAGTRLADAGGLVYRTTKSVTVPGKKTKPGAIDVAVIADKAGIKYDMKVADAKGDFKLIGYKGTDKYDGFYARLKTDLTGGYSGNKIAVAAEVKTATIKSLQEDIKMKLLEKIKTEVPESHILYDGAYSIKYETPEPVMQGDGKALITVKGTVYGAIFKTDTLVKYIAGTEVKKFPSNTYRIDGDRDLTFKISNINDFSIQKGSPMIFTLKGPISVTGTFSESKLKDELKGLKLEQSNAIFTKYPISNAYSLITPFWLRSFPDSPEKIQIEYKK